MAGEVVMGVQVLWKGKTAHTRSPHCPVSESDVRLVIDTPLWAFNLMWWQGTACRECVPDPVLGLKHARKVGWPWWDESKVIEA